MPYIPNVNPNEIIESSWGNTIRDHVVQRFASTPERDAAIPAPVVGMTCYVADVGRLMVYTDKSGTPQWLPPWGTAWGRMDGTRPPAFVNFAAGSQFIPGAVIGTGTVSNRYVRVSFIGNFTPNGTANLSVWFQQGANIQETQYVGNAAGLYQIVTLVNDYPSNTGSVSVIVNSPVGGIADRMTLRVDDIGPAV